MTQLRRRMIEDMTLAGLAASTQAVYLQGVRRLAAHYRRSPDQLSEAEVRSYLLHLRDQRGVARGTFKPHHGGIQFLFAAHARPRVVAVLKKRVRPPKRKRLPNVLSDAEVRAILGRVRNPVPKSCFAAHVCVRPAHQRGRDPRGHGDRRRQRAAARHRQGQQGTARAAAAAGARRAAHASGRRIATRAGSSPAASRNGPISRDALWRTFRAAAREAGITQALHAAFAAAQLCDPAPRERRRYPGRPDPARPRQHRHHGHLHAPDRADPDLAAKPFSTS